MGMIDSNRAYVGLVQKYIGSAYDVVKLVADNMDLIESVAGLDLEALAIIAEDIKDMYEAAGAAASAAADSASDASDYKDAAEGAVSTISGYMTDIEAWLTTIKDYRDDAAGSATAAETERGYSKEWASAARDVPVSTEAGGDGLTYSSLHYAAVAAEILTKISDMNDTYEGYLQDTKEAKDLAIDAKDDAETAKTDAETAAGVAAAKLATFEDRFIGVFNIPPVEDPADPFIDGALYFSNVYPEMFYAWHDGKWVAAYSRLDEKDYLKVADHALIQNNPHGVQLSDVDTDNGITGKLAHWIALDDVPASEATISDFIKAVLTSEVPDIADMNQHLAATGNTHQTLFTELFVDRAVLPPMEAFSEIPLSDTQIALVAKAIKEQVLDTKGEALGIVPLGSNTIIPQQYLPPIASVLNFRGGWEPGKILDPAASNGDFYIVETAGTITLGTTVKLGARATGTVNLAVGDWIIFNGTEWSIVQMPALPPFDGLNGTDSMVPLAATQGAVLKGMIDALLPAQAPGSLTSDGASLSWVDMEKALGNPTGNQGYLKSTRAGVRTWESAIPAAIVSPTIPNDVPVGVEWVDDVTGKAYICFRAQDTTPGSAAPAVWITR